MALLSFMARLGLDATGFEKNMSRADSQVTRFGSRTLGQLKGQLAAAFSVAAVTQFGRAVLNHADRIGDLAEQYNLTTDAVQELMAMAGKTGVEFEKFGNLILKIAQLRERALAPGAAGDGVRSQFAQFGIGADKLGASAISNMELATMWSVALKGATDNATALDMVSTRGIKALSVLQGIKDLGPISIIDKEEVETLSRMNDILGEMWRTTLNFGAKAITRGKDVYDVVKEDPWWLAEGFLEYFGGGGYQGKDLAPTGPITAQELASARDAMGNKKKPPTFGRASRVTPDAFQSSASGSITAAGGYFLGSGQTAAMDLAKQAVDLAKKTLDANARTAKATEKVANQGVTVREEEGP